MDSNLLGDNFRCTQTCQGWFSMHSTILGKIFDALIHFGEDFSMHSNIFGDDFRCTQTFLGMIFDALKHFWGRFSMHSNIYGDDFRCTQTFLVMIFDALKHFWGWFSTHSNIFADEFRCTEKFLGMIFDAPKVFQQQFSMLWLPTSALKSVVLQGPVHWKLWFFKGLYLGWAMDGFLKCIDFVFNVQKNFQCSGRGPLLWKKLSSR